jgi:hypothetical protein
MKQFPMRYLGVGWGGVLLAFVSSVICKRLSGNFYPELSDVEIAGPNWTGADVLFVVVFVLVLALIRIKKALTNRA